MSLISLFSRNFVIFLLSVAIGLSPSPSFTQTQNCSLGGCNIVHDGLFNSQLIGQTVVERQNLSRATVVVIDVDLTSGMLRWRLPSGATGWNYATNYYTVSRSQERDRNALIGIFTVLAGAAAAANSSSQQGPPVSDNSGYQRIECENRCNTQGYDPRGGLNSVEAARHNCIQQCRRY